MDESPAAAAVPARTAGALSRFAGRYLTFRVGDEIYGIAIARVREIVGMQPITRVPESDPCIAGVINLRGRILAVQDLRRKLGLPAAPPTEETCIVVAEGAGLTNGLIVDRVEEVADLAEADLAPPPAVDAPEALRCIGALAKTANRVAILLDSDRLLRTRGMGAATES